MSFLSTYDLSIYRILVANKMFILAIIVWGLLYTALADIFPEHKWEGNISNKMFHLLFIAIWVIVFLGFESISEHGHENEEENHVEERYEDEDHK